MLANNLDVQHIPTLTEDQWVVQHKPIPYTYRLGTGFDYGDGSCLMSFTDL